MEKNYSFPSSCIEDITGLVDAHPECLSSRIREIAFEYAEDCKDTGLSRMRENIITLNKLAMLFEDAQEERV